MPQHLGQAALEPVRLAGREGVNSLFTYELLLKTPDSLSLGASSAADFNLDDFIGREISCTIELNGMGAFITGVVGASKDHLGAGERQINALITEAALWGEAGRHLRYKLKGTATQETTHESTNECWWRVRRVQWANATSRQIAHQRGNSHAQRQRAVVVGAAR
jgi:uncharacterized protein involved in type VI secretion and phage assembly